jgi:hypothetical protein
MILVDINIQVQVMYTALINTFINIKIEVIELRRKHIYTRI